MSTIIESLSVLTIGTVESVSPDEIRVILDLEAPQATALNTGVPTRFPRLNGYVIIPNESGAVVGLVVWLGVERSAFPKRTGLKDFGLIDLPFPLRKVTLIPVGTLLGIKVKGIAETQFRLERGVSVFPSVGDSVLLPTEQQLRSIIESRDLKHQIQIGTSPLAGNAIVSVDPDKLFGRHLAVLGNTGSGKSCSVAGLIRWSLEKAKQEQKKKDNKVNARFIVLDPNGEYSKTFDDLGDGVRKFQVPPVSDGAKALTLPAWMWNSHEWSAFAHAAPGVQRPLLMQGLRDMRAGGTLQEPETFKLGRLLRAYKARFEELVAQGIGAYTGFPNKGLPGLLCIT